ncbi:MAG TPA: hypothetical protein PLG59_00590 [bacterium]|nr:hypothetical protein [bacterium]
MPTTIKEQILSANDLIRVPEFVPEWDCLVYVRELDGAGRSRCMDLFRDEQQRDPDMMAKVLCRTLCDEEGGLLFAESDAPALSKKNGLVIERLFLKSLEVNKIGSKAEEEEIKNSEGTDGDDSYSDSPSVSEDL